MAIREQAFTLDACDVVGDGLGVVCGPAFPVPDFIDRFARGFDKLSPNGRGDV
jgi:hypothetical protein